MVSVMRGESDRMLLVSGVRDGRAEAECWRKLSKVVRPRVE